MERQQCPFAYAFLTAALCHQVLVIESRPAGQLPTHQEFFHAIVWYVPPEGQLSGDRMADVVEKPPTDTSLSRIPSLTPHR